MKVKKLENIASCFIVAAVMALCFVPLMVQRENSIITIHDYLDSILAYTKMYRENDLYWKLDSPMPVYNGMSCAFYTFVNFGVYNLMMNYIGPLWGHILHYILSVVLGYISARTLLRYFWQEEEKLPLIRLVAIAYAILPVIPNVALGYATLPMAAYAFIKLLEKERICWYTLLLLLFPFFSSFYIVGIFIMAFWALGIVIAWIKKKRLPMNLVLGLLCMGLGTVLVDFKLFYSTLMKEEVLNRTIMDLTNAAFMDSLKLYFLEGYYHVASLQKKIVIPACCLLALFCLIRRNWKTLRISSVLLVVMAVFSTIGALYDTGLLGDFFKTYLSILDGFNWGRIYMLNRLLWYVLLLVLMLPLIEKLWGKLMVYGIICLQIVYIYQAPVAYNDSWRNLLHDHSVEEEQQITYAEFYAEDLFAQIKEDISYQGENVAALGYHPSVLMYNGFHALDGYLSSYPLERMIEFRELIEPELEINENARGYYDSWGGRMYLYNSEVSYEPTREKSKEPVTLNIDADVFRRMEGVYVLSRVPISNADDLEMELAKSYVDTEYLYDMYVYRVTEK